MFFIHIISAIILVEVNCVTENASQGLSNVKNRRNFIYDMYKYDTMYNVILNATTEQILDFYEDTDQWRGYPTRVHVSTNESVTDDHPIFITATQQKGISSWELPLVVQTSRSRMIFVSMARTLCPHDGGPNITSVNRPLIQMTTSNAQNISVDIKLRRVTDFYVEVDKEITLTSTTATPKYYYFSFDNNPWNLTTQALRSSYKFLPSFNYTIPKSVILIIESDDDVCAVVSIQNNSCPVFDNEREILYQGYHLTMTNQGGITLTQSMFPTGFYIVFIVKERDDECTGVDGVRGVDRVRGVDWVDGEGVSYEVREGGRNKTFRFRVIATISYSEYTIAASVVLALILTFYLLVVLMSYCRCVWREEVLILEEDPLEPSSSAANPADGAEIVPIMRSDSGSDSESEVDSRESKPRPLTVADLCKSRPNVRANNSDRYFWSAMTVAVVYALPVVQLLVTYQNMVLTTGNQDLCYYNFLCAHPLASLSDFNHVFSNCGYVVLGLLFMWQVRRRRQVHTDLGIPQHPGLFYSMGLALIMEGILSACYHLCPNKMNFQFDSSFMYVIAVLGMVKLYQNRHPDVNARAHTTFLLLAFIMAIGLCGIMYPSVGFWAVFTVLHLATCFSLTFNIYYFGRLKLGRELATRAWSGIKIHRQRAFLPSYTARAVLLAIANVANWALAIYGLIEHNMDFARHLLAILMGNTILYTSFYVIMKLVHRERMRAYTWVYLVLAHVAWFTALRLFLDSKTKWSQTPAQSRRHNAVCTALHMYDSHDLWHLTSAAALFLSFNLLLTVDDALVNTPKHRIPVF